AGLGRPAGRAVPGPPGAHARDRGADAATAGRGARRLRPEDTAARAAVPRPPGPGPAYRLAGRPRRRGRLCRPGAHDPGLPAALRPYARPAAGVPVDGRRSWARGGAQSASTVMDPNGRRASESGLDAPMRDS